ncbi:MAG: ABC transporter ATP-binding protein [Solirubrobacteraceae bacterium]
MSTPGGAGTGRHGGAVEPATSTGTGSAGGEPVLCVESVGKRYGSREALHDISFAAYPGEMVAVIGPNGAGKTTLLSILAGIQAPSTGAFNRASGGAGWGVGWVPQTPALYSKLTVAENLRLFARLEKVDDPEAVVTRMLHQTGLADRAAERVDRLSGGNRQRVNVALGLLADPAVILLDEPSTALDPAQRERLWQFIAELASRGTSVVFSTHIVAEAQRHAQRVVVLDEGRLLFDGPPARLTREAGGNEDFELAFVSFLSARAQA